jgi:hypothetical protein
MQVENSMKTGRIQGELYLDDTLVGLVTVKGEDNSWHFGEFEPCEAFSTFAPLFGRWSLLMHADEDADRLSNAAADELREVEQAIDRVRARLRLFDTGEWRDLRQLNIDGELIDWKA